MSSEPKKKPSEAPARKDIFQKCAAFDEPQKVKMMGLYPYFRTIEQTIGNQVVCGGRRKIMIGSNNYLGLAQDERVVEAAIEATRKYGAGCTGSRFLNGNIRMHEELEEELDHFRKRHEKNIALKKELRSFKGKCF